jgi:hypothetical protein
VSPETTITQGPAAVTSARSATFRWASATKGGNPSRFDCRLDGGEWITDCPMPYTTSDLTADGEHTLEVRQVVRTGFAVTLELEPARWTWTVDTKAPVTSLTGVSASGADASVTFTTGEEGTTSECSLDDGPWTPCASPARYSGLAAGMHTVRIRSIDAAGNREEKGTSATWRADPPAPCCAPPIRPEPNPEPKPPVAQPPTLEQLRAAARAGLKTSVRRSGRLRRAQAVSVDVGSAVAARVRVTGSIRMAGRRRAIGLRAFGGRVEAGRSVRAKLRLSKAARAVLRRRGGPRTVVVRLKVALATADGDALATRSIRLRVSR